MDTSNDTSHFFVIISPRTISYTIFRAYFTIYTATFNSMNNLINTLRSMTYNTERKSRGQGSAVRQARNKDIARVDRSKGACEESMAERNLIHFDVASPESAISDLPPPLLRSERGPFDGSPDIGPRLETRSRLPLPPPPPLLLSREAEHWKRGVGEKKEERGGDIPPRNIWPLDLRSYRTRWYIQLGKQESRY